MKNIIQFFHNLCMITSSHKQNNVVLEKADKCSSTERMAERAAKNQDEKSQSKMNHEEVENERIYVFHKYERKGV
jgi:hypothetical protein